MENLKITECHSAHRHYVGAGNTPSNDSNITIKFFIILTVYCTGEIETFSGLRITVRKVWRKLNFVQVGIQYTQDHEYVCVCV